MKHFIDNIKMRWAAYLDRLAKVNKEIYGTQRLDCCDLKNKKKLHKDS
ncbi:MAG: hypothetical protein JJE21_09575 [Spirochaetaceae bacterium]|nr:hypothetical protein [Spirochaetaceae bacterium]